MKRIEEIRDESQEYEFEKSTRCHTLEWTDIYLILSHISSLESDLTRLIEAAEPINERFKEYDSQVLSEGDIAMKWVPVYKEDLRILSAIVEEVKRR